MTPAALTVLFLLLPAAALSLLTAQPRGAWRAGAEHSRWFWSGWVLLAVAVGLAGWARFGGTLGTGWLVFWCAVGSLQPSMIADVVDVRRLRPGPTRRRRPTVAVIDPHQPPRPIHWRAPAADVASWIPRAQAG